MLYKVSDEIIKFVKKIMKNLEVELTTGTVFEVDEGGTSKNGAGNKKNNVDA